MDHQDVTDRPLPKPSDFTGSPFRLLPRVGDKMYRPSRPAAPTGATATPSTASMDGRRLREPGVWDWG